MTPTLLNSALECPARAGFERDVRTKSLKRKGLRASLGSVAHKTWELRKSGRSFEEVWDEAINDECRLLKQVWAPARPPSPENWPGWALTMVRMRRGFGVDQPKILNRTVEAPSHTWGNGSNAAAIQPLDVVALPLVERWLKDDRLHMGGKPDLVTMMDDDLVVVDLKSGVQQGEPNEDQIRQLHFYSALVEANFGVCPNRGEIRSASGRTYEIRIDPEQVLNLVESAYEAWTLLNKASVNGDEVLAANPKDDVCWKCPFRLVCREFLEAYDITWRAGNTIVGRIQNIQVVDGHSTLDLEVLLPTVRKGKIRLFGFPFPEEAAVGEIWGVSDFEGTGGTGLARWNSLIFRWP